MQDNINCTNSTNTVTLPSPSSVPVMRLKRKTSMADLNSQQPQHLIASVLVSYYLRITTR